MSWALKRERILVRRGGGGPCRWERTVWKRETEEKAGVEEPRQPSEWWLRARGSWEVILERETEAQCGDSNPSSRV